MNIDYKQIVSPVSTSRLPHVYSSPLAMGGYVACLPRVSAIRPQPSALIFIALGDMWEDLPEEAGSAVRSGDSCDVQGIRGRFEIIRSAFARLTTILRDILFAK